MAKELSQTIHHGWNDFPHSCPQSGLLDKISFLAALHACRVLIPDGTPIGRQSLDTGSPKKFLDKVLLEIQLDLI